jgi:hypothetical protein
MLKPLDRHRRDSTLYQFTSWRLRDCIDPDQLLIQIDEQFDFAFQPAIDERQSLPPRRRGSRSWTIWPLSPRPPTFCCWGPPEWARPIWP